MSAPVVSRSAQAILRTRVRLLAAFAGVVALALTGAAPALAAAPWWHIDSEVTPTYLPPQVEGTAGTGQIVVVASNVGDGLVNGGGGDPVVVTDKLPAHLIATAVSSPTVNGTALKCQIEKGEPREVRCTYAGILNPYERLAFTITVKVEVEEPPGAIATLPDEVSVQGGGAQSISSIQHAVISGDPTPFGVQSDELSLYNEDGAPDTQAGSHPFELTQTLVMNQTGQNNARQPVALPKDLRFYLPPGLIGDPSATEQCPMTDFTAIVELSTTNLCPPGSVVGVVSVTVYEPALSGDHTLEAPLFNLVPAQGEPARFGFEVLGLVPIVIDTSVLSGGSYSVVASVKNTTELAGLVSSQVTFWGVPGDARHDQSRGWECLGGKSCSTPPGLSQTPLLSMPTACPAGEPLISSVEADSWAAPGDFGEPFTYVWSGPLGEPLGLEPESCAKLPFSPSLAVTSETSRASTPTGLSVKVKLPQAPTLEPNPEGRAEADVRDTTVRLPAGVQVSPSAANGLEACPESPEGGSEGIGFTGFTKLSGAEPEPETATFTPSFRLKEEESGGEKLPPSCPEASKVGLVHIKTPLLPRELEGAMYLATPAPNGEAGKNPFNSLIALYIVAEDREAGVLVKLAGEGRLEGPAGRISTTFRSTPQLPFEELDVELFGGERASLTTPPLCASYGPEAEAELTAWSGATRKLASESPLSILSGPGGGACPSSPLPFSPGFDAQVTNAQAGAFSPFELELARPDGDRALTGVEVHMPPGIAALLSSVTPCPEPPAGQEWACGEESLIGHSTAFSGLGGKPIALEGKAYLTVGYDGAPFGLLVQTPAHAGPFELGMVNVRSRINVNESTAAVTITTDPGPRGESLPTMLKGIPVQLKRLLVTVDRDHFEFNPTSCNPMRIDGTLTGAEAGTGADQATAGVSSPFQLGGCASLPFAPKLTASAGGHGSKVDGTSLDVKIEAPAPGASGLAQANIAKVDLQLPAALSTRLPTLQKACLEAVFDANPAACDEGSVIGSATVHTPVLKTPLSGPAYLVSHGGAEFPDVEFVLQGEGVRLVLDGKTDIKDKITYSKFESAPDAPFTLFETELPAGPHSVLTPNVPEAEDFNLCKTKLAMPTTITAQDGSVLEQDTSVAVTGCGGVLPEKKVKPSRAQLLAKALHACRKDKKRSRRLACEKRARKRYGAKSAAHKTTVTAKRRHAG
ncbi:MAG: hypothetical protein ACLPUT_04850 [Solirubrobacteraceae bacterium]